MDTKPGRRIVIAAMTAAGLAIVLVLLAALALPAVVEGRAEAALRDAGFPEAEVEIDRLGLGGAEAGVRLTGNQGADRVAVDWHPAGLLGPRIDRVVVEGLRLEFETADGGPRIAGRKSPDATGAPNAPLLPDMPVDSIELRRATLALATPAGTVTVPLDGTLTRTAPGHYRIGGTATVRILEALGVATVDGRFTPEDGLEIEIAMDPPAGVEAQGTGALAGRARLSLPPAAPVSGTAALTLAGLQVPVAGQVSGTLDWQAAGGSHRLEAGLAAQHGLSARIDAGLDPQAAGPPVVAVDARIDAADLKAAAALFGLELPIAGQAALGLSADGPVQGALPPIRADLRIDRGAWGDLIGDGTVRAGGRAILDGGALRFEADRELVVEGRPGKALRARAPLPFAEGSLRVALGPPADGKPLVLTLSTSEGRRTAELSARIGIEAGRVQGGGLADAARITLDGDGVVEGALALADGAFEAAAGTLAAHGLSLRTEYVRGREVPLVAGSTVAGLKLGPGKGWVAPLATTIELSGDPSGALGFKASGEAAAGALVIDVAGQHDMRTGTGSGQMVLHPVRFAEGLRSPADIFPILADRVDSGTGRIGVRLNHAWGPQAPAGRGELLLEDLSLAGPGIAIRGLNGVVVANSLTPLTTHPEQLLSIALLDVGIPLADGLIRFAVGEGKTGAGERLSVDLAQFTWAGGTVLAKPFALPLRNPRGTVVLEASKLDLGRVLALAGVEGLAATGTLDGRIPVAITGDAVRFEGGRLGAIGEGTIRYDPAEPPAFLDPSRNENTALVMQVLQDFHYKDLAVTIDGTVGGEMAVALKLQGANPNFYGGYPVALNLNLSGALDTILRSGLGTYRIPDEVRARIEQYQKAAP